MSQNWGYFFGGPHNKDYNISGSILGSPDFGKLPCGSRIPLRTGGLNKLGPAAAQD